MLTPRRNRLDRSAAFSRAFPRRSAECSREFINTARGPEETISLQIFKYLFIFIGIYILRRQIVNLLANYRIDNYTSGQFR